MVDLYQIISIVTVSVNEINTPTKRERNVRMDFLKTLTQTKKRTGYLLSIRHTLKVTI